MWRRIALASLAALALGGCATRGSIAINCAGFDDWVHPLPASRLLRDIQADALTKIELFAAKSPDSAAGEKARTPLETSLAELVRLQNGSAEALEGGGDALLLLSGGGQWGAFGAGYVSTLAEPGG